ncbi:CDP-glycerol glycerophosphotransferase family protein [Phaeodactylibacter xiamenensis]|uniref:CDP-glycerol glycerophosphotransferase family protein n=1 Tax=Phaeodactylibacter xiamenensis TaxID=1524460 RepID=UPI0024A85AE7|nr:CDP-glycerol glycerophosphotransferase family protein [Phaeodactylibacter xiamenensis]
MRLLRTWIKKTPFYKPLSLLLSKSKIYATRRSHQKKLIELKKKETIKVLFIVIFDSVWKYEEFYRLLDESGRFEPLIVIAPHTNLVEEDMIKQVEHIYEKFKNKGYRVESSYDPSKGWLDYKSIYKPDIVCFTTPYNYTISCYQFTWFYDVLTIYVPYAFVVIHKLELHYKMFFYNVLWKYFVESGIHKSYAKQFALLNTRHVIVSGYPGLDLLLQKQRLDNEIWKNPRNGRIRRVIWAPHHTIAGEGAGLDYSTFLSYYEVFIDLVEHYKGDLQIAFKPHPLLKAKLYKNKEWGKTRADEYYNFWRNHPNGQLEEGDYIDLFHTSDALIHDSASFMAEYMVTKKPILFLVADKNLPSRFNSFGKELFQRHYRSETTEEVSRFIEGVVFEKNDSMYNIRAEFVEKHLTPPNKQTAAKNMLDHIQKQLR